MPILHQAQLGKVTLYILKPLLESAETNKLEKTYVQPEQIELIINDDADVYDENGMLLAKFRKGLIARETQTTFYEALGKHIHKNTKMRGNATSTFIDNEKCVGLTRCQLITKFNGQCKSNIFGFFDTWAMGYKKHFTENGNKPPTEARTCAWNYYNPEEYQRTIPLITEVDKWYEKLVPDKYLLQKRSADKIFMKIGNTSFSTVTTNVNFQTALHHDKGDDPEGFGNLSVIQYGDYTGGETCLVQYGIGFNVRSGDILFMDVHKLHGNLPIEYGENAIRCSIVCYLRKKLVERLEGWTEEQTKQYITNAQNIFKKNSNGLRNCDTDL